MERKIVIGVVVVSAVIAVVAVTQSQSSYRTEAYEDFFDVRYQPLPAGAEDVEVEVAEEAEALFSRLPSPGADEPAGEQKVIKTSYLSLEVDDVRAAAAAVEDIARKYNGYKADSSTRDIGERKIGYVTVRVPGEHFEDALREIEAVGELKEENITVEDVTEEYVDLAARLKNLERQEERYLEILDMAETVEDVLKVENQLERIRGDIEQLQGRLTYLTNRIDFSTVQVRLSEPEIITHESGIGRAFSEAIDGFLSAIRGIIIFLGYFIPIAAFLTILAFAGRFIYKKVSKEH
jgi:hypothetical protein